MTRLIPAEARTTAEWQSADTAHFLHPFTDHQALGKKGARIITRAEGVWVWDSEGHQIFDGMSGLWCVNAGYGQRALIDAATEQLKELPFYNAFFQTSHPAAITLAEELSSVMPKGFSRVFFTSSGSEANDTVVRMVRRYWDLQGQPDRQVIISRTNAYHGSTMAGASLGGMASMHAQGGLPIPGIVHIDQPYWLQHGQGMRRDEFGEMAASWLEARILAIGPDKVAAFIGEPIQGAGGVIIPPATYWPQVQRICRQYGVLLVADEVICGFGRTGAWFGCETMGFTPDLITFAKGVTSGYQPLGGVMLGDQVADALITKGGEFTHGYTYSGHPVACAVGVANIRLIRDQKLVQKVAVDTGPYLKQAFDSLKDHPLVGDAETCGLLGAVWLSPAPKERRFFGAEVPIGMAFRDHCFDEGVIMRAIKDRMVVCPPMIATRADIDEMTRRIRRCLDLTLQDARRAGWVMA